jgi:tRNA acetyltransferase TAN1
MDNFNLLVSSARGTEEEANQEMQYLLRELGDPAPITDFVPISGLTVARTRLDPIKAISGLRRILKQRPWQFRYILKVKPVEQVVPCEISAIRDAVVDRIKKVRADETFRVSLEKRRNQISSREIIDAVAQRVPRKVELRTPDKIVLIEVMGNIAGVSIISPRSILGIEKEKRIPSPAREVELTVQR